MDDGRGAVKFDVHEFVASLVTGRDGLGGGRLVYSDVDFPGETVQLRHVLRSLPVVLLRKVMVHEDKVRCTSELCGAGLKGGEES